MKRTQSERLFLKAREYFPGGVNSPVRAFRSVGGTPVFMVRGKGPYVWDADGNHYLDFCCSWGPLISGHAPDFVVEEVKKRVENGSTFGTPTIEENQLAELILSNHRYIEKIRFVSSGTEAVMSALRLARGFTGRSKILKFEGCYHGHVDALLVKAGSGLVTFGQSTSAGITNCIAQDTIVVPLNSDDALRQAFELYGKEIAAAIIEPVPANNALLIQRKEYLQLLRKLCSANGALLIFDEVISGFRVGFEGAAGYYDIHPDLVTYGKVIGGGFPVGAYAGKREIMDQVSPLGPVYQAGTLSGNPVAMIAGYTQLKHCLSPGFYQKLEEKTRYFSEALNDINPEQFNVSFMGSIFWLNFSSEKNIASPDKIKSDGVEKFNRAYHRLLEHGIYFGPSAYEVGFISEAHELEHLDFAISVFKKIIPEILK
ncbi:MAG: glutamate-1-semialdehyde 2,1-aminomutase [Bacteroidia bacterium]|nr:glutamate-1-semialdehyde 2,1-aminomutase [Bacteroidia bacterium]